MLNLPLINSDALACSYPSAICYSGNGRVTVTLSSSWLSVVRPLEMFQKYQEFTTESHFTSVTTVNEKRPTLKSPRPQLTRSMRKVSKVPPNRVAPLRSTAWTERFPLLHAWTTTNIPASRRYTGQPRVVAAIISLLPRTCSVNGHINARTHTSPAALPKPAGAGFKQKSPFPSNRNGIYIYIYLYIFIYFKAATKCTVCLFVFDDQCERYKSNTTKSFMLMAFPSRVWVASLLHTLRVCAMMSWVGSAWRTALWFVPITQRWKAKVLSAKCLSCLTELWLPQAAS